MRCLPGGAFFCCLMLMLAHAQKLHIAYDGKLYPGVLHAGGHASDGDGAAALFGQPFELFPDIGDDAGVLQKALQKLRSAHISGKHHDAKALL